jgi:hypothetical protein
MAFSAISHPEKGKIATIMMLVVEAEWLKCVTKSGYDILWVQTMDLNKIVGVTEKIRPDNSPNTVPTRT